MVNRIVVVGKDVGVYLADAPRLVVQLNSVRGHCGLPFGL